MLALGLAAASSARLPRSLRGTTRRTAIQPQAEAEPYGDDGNAQYDYARVVRVDPVIVSGYRESDGRNGYPARSSVAIRARTAITQATTADMAMMAITTIAAMATATMAIATTTTTAAIAAAPMPGADVATVIGGVVGAVLGSKVGGGSARYATAAVGTMVGGIAGRQIYESNNRYRQSRNGVVTVCDPVPADGRGYSVDDSRVGAYDVTYEYAGRRYTTRTDYHPGDTIRVRVDVRPE